MGNGGSTSIEIKGNNPDTSKYNLANNANKLLYYERCIYLTFDKYKSKVHLPSNMYVDYGVASNIKNNDELNNFLISRIKKVADTLSSYTGVPSRVPSPIYVMYAKKKEYVSTILGQCFEDVKKGIYDSANCNEHDSVGFYRFIAEYTNKNELDFKKSNMGIYSFLGNYEYYIYYPNLTKNIKYMTNYNSVLLTNIWMGNLIRNNYLFNIMRNDKDIIMLKERMTNFFPPSSENLIDQIFNILQSTYNKNNPYETELLNTCYNNGCVSDYGEDFDQMLPKRTTDVSQQESLAKEKAPYYPAKCLLQPNYSDNMITIDEKFINDMKKLMKVSLLIYKTNAESIRQQSRQEGGISFDKIPQNMEITLYDEIKKNFYNYLSTNSSENLNDKALYHYSKQYNKNILTELSQRYNSYPGVQEVTFPIFKVNTENSLISKMILNLPWGDKLITNNYLISSDIILEINKKIYSFNNQFYLILNKNGIIECRTYNANNVIYTLSDIFYNNVLNVKFENGSLNLYINENNKEVLASSFNIIDIQKSFGLDPYSVILENNHMINVYGDKFTIITNDALTNRINLSANYINKYGYNPDLQIDLSKWNGKDNLYDIKSKINDIGGIGGIYSSSSIYNTKPIFTKYIK